MSFAITTPQFLARTKHVTRRLGWSTLRAGALVTAIEKGQGLKRGEKVRLLGTIRVLDVRTEPLNYLVHNPAYGKAEAILEGFPDLDGPGFVAMFCAANRCVPSRPVRRVLFEYVLVNCRKGRGPGHSIDEGATCAHCLLVA